MLRPYKSTELVLEPLLIEMLARFICTNLLIVVVDRALEVANPSVIFAYALVVVSNRLPLLRLLWTKLALKLRDVYPFRHDRDPSTYMAT